MKSLRASTGCQVKTTSSAKKTFNAISMRRVRFSIFALVALVGLAFYSGSHAAPFLRNSGKSAVAPAQDAKNSSRFARKNVALGKDNLHKYG